MTNYIERDLASIIQLNDDDRVVVIVGSPCVGKTTLINHLVGNTPHCNIQLEHQNLGSCLPDVSLQNLPSDHTLIVEQKDPAHTFALACLIKKQLLPPHSHYKHHDAVLVGRTAPRRSTDGLPSVASVPGRTGGQKLLECGHPLPAAAPDLRQLSVYRSGQRSQQRAATRPHSRQNSQCAFAQCLSAKKADPLNTVACTGPKYRTGAH